MARGSLSPLNLGTCWHGGKGTEHLGLSSRSFGQVAPPPGPTVLLVECGWLYWACRVSGPCWDAGPTCLLRGFLWIHHEELNYFHPENGCVPFPSKAQGPAARHPPPLFRMGCKMPAVALALRSWEARCGAERTAPFLSAPGQALRAPGKGRGGGGGALRASPKCTAQASTTQS